MIELTEKYERQEEGLHKQLSQNKLWLEEGKNREARLLRDLELSHEEVANLQKEVSDFMLHPFTS